MKVNKLIISLKEAKRFVDRGDKLLDEMEKNPDIEKSVNAGMGNKYSSAVKRASMDLSRALSDLRR